MKLFITDIDGTLRGKQGIPPVLQAWLRHCGSYGLAWTGCTGRGYARALEALGECQPTAPLLVEDGARMVAGSGETLSFNAISGEELQLLTPILTEPTLELACFCPRDDDKYVFFTNGTEAHQRIEREFAAILGRVVTSTHQFIALATQLQCAKVSMVGQAMQDMLLPAGVEGTLNEGLLNINPRGVNKGTGALALATRLGISPADVVVAGNDHNDVHLFRPEFGARICVGPTAPAALKERATHLASCPEQLPAVLSQIISP